MQQQLGQSAIIFDDTYFMLESVDTICSHVISLYASKVMAYTKNDKQVDISLEKETDDAAVFIHTSEPGVSQKEGVQVETLFVIRMELA